MDGQFDKYPPPAVLETGKKEAIFGAMTLVFGLWLGNALMFGGVNLTAALALGAACLGSLWYVLSAPCRGSAYGWVLLAVSGLILPGFVRSDDAFVKFVLLLFFFVGFNLGLATLAGKTLHDPGQVQSLLDPLRVFFGQGIGKIGAACRGITAAVRSGGEGVRRATAVGAGALAAVPVLAVMIPLLMSADAAFEGLLELLPEFRLGELVLTVIYGGMLVCVLYTRTVALVQWDPGEKTAREARGISVFTVNTVLLAVDGLYLVYLFSQLAYFVGGFAGILPEGYSLAEYARRGFFEMAWLTAINLSVMVLGISLVEKRSGRAPLAVRLSCLFLGLVTVFFVTASGAKMVMYIGGYGMTRLRVLTMVIVVFLGLTTAAVTVWLFRPRLPYMKAVLLAGLLLGTAVLWADVDTVVASYNTDAYLSGRLEAMDLYHLTTLGSGAVPSLHRLATEAWDEDIRQGARAALEDWYLALCRDREEDWRQWNLTDHIAREYLQHWPTEPENPCPEDALLHP